MNKPQLVKGNIAVDDRGTLSFVNDFGFEGVRRFYQVQNFAEGTVRAWHGHKKEKKWAYVSKGAAIIACVQFDDETSPSRNAEVHRFVLSEHQPAVLAIPAGYANGFRPLMPGTIIIFFSSSTLEEAKGDDFRFSADYWGNQVWEVQNR